MNHLNMKLGQLMDIVMDNIFNESLHGLKEWVLTLVLFHLQI